MIITECKVI